MLILSLDASASLIDGLIDCQCSDGGEGEVCGVCLSVEGEAWREGVIDGYYIQCLQH